jgi:hypothetical protein
VFGGAGREECGEATAETTLSRHASPP